MREQIAKALRDAESTTDKRRQSMLRLIQTAIADRDASARDGGRDGVSDEEILEILGKMFKQREISAAAYEEAGQLELASAEKAECEVLREFLPKRIAEDEMKVLCEKMVHDLNAEGLRDIGRCMNELKERYPGQMDFVQASCVMRGLLRLDGKD
ncbi:MAG: GatB/YqeY domain-containing protein [Rhodobacteraceae bacterium]|nr:GatB/YqeY domain-containing protein [Paracoccaceae bacterium]